MSRVALAGVALAFVGCSSQQDTTPPPDGGTDSAPIVDGATPLDANDSGPSQRDAGPPPKQCDYAALTPSAALDPTFSTAQITVPLPQAVYSFSRLNSWLVGMAIDSKHRTVLAGEVFLKTQGGVDPNSRLGTIRLNADGTFDATYGLEATNLKMVGGIATGADSKDRVVVLTGDTLLRLDNGQPDGFGMISTTGLINISGRISVDGTDVYLWPTTQGPLHYREDGSVDPAFKPSLGQRTLRAIGFTPGCILALTDPSSVLDPSRLECWKRSDGSLDTTFGNGGSVTLPGAYFTNNYVLGQVTGEAIIVRVDTTTTVYRVTSTGTLDAKYTTRTLPREWTLVSSTCGHTFGAWLEIAQGKYSGKAQLFHLDGLGADVNPSNALVDSTLGSLTAALFDPGTGQLVAANGVSAAARVNPP